MNVTTGAAELFDTLQTGSDCGLGNKDLQDFSLSNLGGRIFVGNRGCNTITIYDDQDPPQEVQGLANNPLVLETRNPPIVELLYTKRFEVFAGRGGDFGFCGDTEATGCPLALEEDGGVMWGMTNINPFPTQYREFEFVVLDCTEIPGDCPTVNCPSRWPAWNDNSCPEPDPQKQVIDLMQLWLQTEDGPVFRKLAYGDGPVEQALLPYWLGAQTAVPADGYGLPVDCVANPGSCIGVDPELISIVIVTDALFTGTFFVDYRLREFLPEAANDECVPLPFNSTVGEANEVYPPIIYHSSDGFGTVDRSVSPDPNTAVLKDRGGHTMTDLCNNRGSGFRFSSNTINVELKNRHVDELVLQAHRMTGELQQFKDEKICAQFENPDYDPLDPLQGPEFLGPLLDPEGSDCASIQSELDQVKQKLAVCYDAIYFPQGNSEENCNALFTKLANLGSRLAVANYQDNGEPRTLIPNYPGEFESRLRALVFFLQEFVLKAVPPGGIANTQDPPLQPPPLLD